MLLASADREMQRWGKTLALCQDTSDASHESIGAPEVTMGDKSPKSKEKNKKQKDSVKEQSKKRKDAQTAAKAKKVG